MGSVLIIDDDKELCALMKKMYRARRNVSFGGKWWYRGFTFDR